MYHLRDSSTLLDFCIIDAIIDFGQYGMVFLLVYDLIYVRCSIRIYDARSNLLRVVTLNSTRRSFSPKYKAWT